MNEETTAPDALDNENMQAAVDENAPAWQRYAGEEISLDWYINYAWFATPWGQNLVSQTITEETGVSVNFITPMGNEEEKLNALIASDKLPDIITLGYWENQVDEMIEKDMVYALNELADEYDPYFYEVTDQAVVNWYTEEDGNIYAYPNSSISPQDLKDNNRIGSNQTFLVRKDIYEALGCPEMSTPEGFADAVRKAAEIYQNMNTKVLIPIGAHVFDETGCVSFDKYLMNFLAVPWEKDGKLYDRYTDSEYITWLKMFRQLGEEGYLANDIFVDTRTQMEEKLAEGRYFCMIYQYTDPQSLIKAAFELKAMCLAGYEPLLDGCAVCGAETPADPRFHLREGVLHCASCRGEMGDGISMPLDDAGLKAMQHIAWGDPKRLFSIALGEESLKRFSDLTEAYLHTQLERGFHTLDFYKSIKL